METLAQLSAQFAQLVESPDCATRNTQAENLKSAFYKRLLADREVAAKTQDDPAALLASLDVLEEGFKAVYAKYKQIRGEYLQAEDERLEANFEAKSAIVEELRDLVEHPGDMKDVFQRFRALQDRWREAGPVSAHRLKEINDQYQLQVTRFYDLMEINRELRDMDFRKNLEAKTALCEAAEALAQEADVVAAFQKLQELHAQWKDLGPVEKEQREAIWERFRAATTVLNKAHQAHFEGIKAQQADNLKAKEALCEEAEAIAAREDTAPGQWNASFKDIVALQAQWKEVGMVDRKESKKIYDRFRAACDSFFEKKRTAMSAFKDTLSANLERKRSLVEQAEALCGETEDRKATAEKLIALQKEWKTIGPVPRKVSDALWERFHKACDSFFNAPRDRGARQHPSHGEVATRHTSAPGGGLREQIAHLRQEILTYENNIGFFSISNRSSSDALRSQIEQRIAAAKERLAELEKKQREAREAPTQTEAASQEVAPKS